MLAADALKLSPSSTVSKISPMPKRPMTAMIKSNPLHESGETEGHAQLAGDDVEADGARMKPIMIETTDLRGLPPPNPTKPEKVRS